MLPAEVYHINFLLAYIRHSGGNKPDWKALIEDLGTNLTVSAYRARYQMLVDRYGVVEPEGSDEPEKKRRGRPKGSGNVAKKNKLNEDAAGAEGVQGEGGIVEKKKRGRPKGSKNKEKENGAPVTPEAEANEEQAEEEDMAIKGEP
ncbi:hypothetical protein EDC01DRAFT_788055 [Geopyxis carbonaria]|nr:hypothetical protein EDC01DRAFT_788055 [Geopyxis carbonaria]